MATQILRLNEILTLDVTVGEGNQYADEVYLKFEHNHGHGKIHEAHVTPTQLELLGRFLIRQADEIRTAHSFRDQA